MALIDVRENGTSINLPAGLGKKIGLVLLALLTIALLWTAIVPNFSQKITSDEVHPSPDQMEQKVSRAATKMIAENGGENVKISSVEEIPRDSVVNFLKGNNIPVNSKTDPGLSEDCIQAVYFRYTYTGSNGTAGDGYIVAWQSKNGKWRYD